MQLPEQFESPNYQKYPKDSVQGMPDPIEGQRIITSATDKRYSHTCRDDRGTFTKSSLRYSGPTTVMTRNISLRHPRRTHISLKEGQGFSLGRFHRRQPIAREWSTGRKRITATIACLNTVFVGLITGIYVSLVQSGGRDVSRAV